MVVKMNGDYIDYGRIRKNITLNKQKLNTFLYHNGRKHDGKGSKPIW